VIVDCHTHWGMAWTARDGEDPARWLAELDRLGVDRAVVMPHEGIRRLDRCAADNDRVARVARRAAGRLLPAATAWPQAGTEALAEARRAIEMLGARALKFHPWMQGFSTAEAVFGELCALAGEKGVPVVFHDGTPCYALPEQVGGLARRFPATTFVLGHGGLLWHWRSALAAAERPNVWVCLCGPHQRAIERFCAQADPDRLVWGSDYGFGLEASCLDYRLAALRGARVPEELQARILGENALRLLGLAE